MPVINLLVQSSPTKSTDQNAASLINMYMVADNDMGKYNSAAYLTPGLTVFSTVNSPIRAMYQEHGVLYTIGGNTLYSIASNGTSTVLGTLNTSSGFAKIRGINQQLLIIDGSNGYSYNIQTTAFNTISSTTYVSAVVMTAAGMNYSNPTVVFTDATGTGAAGIATVLNGQITAVIVTAVGNGYTNPTVSFTDATGTGATATAYTTTSTFNNNVIDIECQDEFGLALGNNSQLWYSSDISDLTTWPALSQASTTGNQNNLVAIASLDRYIWLFQQQTTEIWYNAGTAFFTWARYQAAYIQWGCAATQSVAIGNNTITLLGQSSTGGLQVIMMNGFGSPQIISNPGVAYQISTYSTVNDAVGFVYQQEGHEFYVLTFPTEEVTWVFDYSSQTWHQRQSFVDSAQTRWLPSSYAYCYNKQLVGDFNSGNIYHLDMQVFTENGTEITRTIETHPYYSSGSQVYCSRLQIDFDQTPGTELSEINLFVSRDGGNTFGTAKPAMPVQTSDGQWRVYWPRLGRARTWVFQIQTSLNNKFIVLGAWANFSTGDN